MKKIISIVLVMAMVLAFAACGKKEEPAANIANPVTEYSSLEEINAVVASNMVGPGVMGVSDESFCVIDTDPKIAQYKFSVNGHEYCYRASAALDDISGVYVDDSTLFAVLAEGAEANIATDSYYGARWYTIDCQYCLTTESKDLTAEQFSAIAEELKDLALPLSLANLPANSELIGSYEDSFSQRAVLEITAIDGSDKVRAVVVWGSSAFERDTWTMTCGFSEDGLFSYSDGLHERITCAESGEETVETLEENQIGFFNYDAEAKTLSWTGAADEDCQPCVFVQLEVAVSE